MLPVSAVQTYCFFSLKLNSHLSLADPLASVGLCCVVYWVFISRNNACCFSHSVFVHCDPKFNTSFLIFCYRKCQYFEITFPLRPTSTEHRNNHIACLCTALWAEMNDVPVSSANHIPFNHSLKSIKSDKSPADNEPKYADVKKADNCPTVYDAPFFAAQQGYVLLRVKWVCSANAVSIHPPTRGSQAIGFIPCIYSH